MLDALPVLTSTRAARGSPQAQVDLGPAVLLAVLGNDDWSIIRRNGRILSQSFPAEHACCTWILPSFGAFGSSRFSRQDKAFAVQSTVARDIWLIRVLTKAQS